MSSFTKCNSHDEEKEEIRCSLKLATSVKWVIQQTKKSTHGFLHEFVASQFPSHMINDYCQKAFYMHLPKDYVFSV